MISLISVLFLFIQISSSHKTSRRATCQFDVGYDVGSVAQNAQNLASHSWEYGTAAEALLEWFDPSLSVFGTNPFPDGQVPSVDWTQVDSLSYVRPFISTNSQILVDGDGKYIREPRP